MNTNKNSDKLYSTVEKETYLLIYTIRRQIIIFRIDNGVFINSTFIKVIIYVNFSCKLVCGFDWNVIITYIKNSIIDCQNKLLDDRCQLLLPRFLRYSLRVQSVAVFHYWTICILSIRDYDGSRTAGSWLCTLFRKKACFHYV